MSLSADRIGMVVSTVCAVHCGVGPFLFVLLPWAEAWTQGLEWVLLGLAVGIAAVAFGMGYRTHRDVRVGLWFLGGFLWIGLGHGYGSAYGRVPEVLAVAAGAACLIVGHLRNQRLCRCAGCPSCRSAGEGSASP